MSHEQTIWRLAVSRHAPAAEAATEITRGLEHGDELVRECAAIAAEWFFASATRIKEYPALWSALCAAAISDHASEVRRRAAECVHQHDETHP